MNATTFWRLVETARGASEGDIRRQAELLTQELTKLAPEEIYSFHQLLGAFLCAAYQWDLWAAAYLVMNRDCSTDIFDYFRGWLIAQGEAAFRAVLANPENLSDVVGDQHLDQIAYKGQSILGATLDAYELRTGAEMPEDSSAPCELIGERWADEELPRKYPRLWARYRWEE